MTHYLTRSSNKPLIFIEISNSLISLFLNFFDNKILETIIPQALI